MLEADLVSKMLRAVLQSHKNGIVLPRLQGEYRSLTGDWIPFKQLGYPTLEAYLRSVPAVVRIEASRSGEIVCYAVACTETARIAQLVARQRTSKRKIGRQINCQMRVKKAMPFFLEGKPKATLRQPGFASDYSISRKPNSALLRDRGSALGVKADVDMPPYPDTPVQRHASMSANSRFSPKSSLPASFQTHISRACPTEVNDNLNQTVEKPNITPPASYTNKMDEVQNRIKEILDKHNNGIWISKLPHFYKEFYKEDLNQGVLQQFEHWPHICTVEKPCGGGQDSLLYPARREQPLKSDQDPEKELPPPPPAPKQEVPSQGSPAVMPDVKEKVAESLRKSHPEVIKKSVLDHTSSFSLEELPPPVHLSRSGEHMDVYVPVACHPGHFVIQPWQEIHKLEVLMEEMILYYSVSEERHIAVERDLA